MSGLEIPFTKKVCSKLQACNAIVWPLVASLRNAPHRPDRLVWHRYWHGLLEFKGEHTKLTTGQRLTIIELNNRVPGSAFVIRYPGIVEDAEGRELARFCNSANQINVVELLKDLQTLQKMLQDAN